MAELNNTNTDNITPEPNYNQLEGKAPNTNSGVSDLNGKTAVTVGNTTMVETEMPPDTVSCSL